MIGSSQNVSFCNCVLNTAVGNVIGEICDSLGDIPQNEVSTCIVDILQPLISEAMCVVFNGNGYSKEWL